MYSLSSFSRIRSAQGLLGTLPCSQEARRNFVTQPWILIWLLQNELAFCDLGCIETNPSSAPGFRTSARMWYIACIKDVVHGLYHPPQVSVETWGICFVDHFPGTWNRLSMFQHQAFIGFISSPFPLAAPFPPHSSSISSQGSFLSKRRIGSASRLSSKILVSDLSFKSFVGLTWTNERPREMNMYFKSGNEEECLWPNLSAIPHLVSFRRFPWGLFQAVRNRFVFLIKAKQETKASMVTIHLGKSTLESMLNSALFEMQVSKASCFPSPSSGPEQFGVGEQSSRTNRDNTGIDLHSHHR